MSKTILLTAEQRLGFSFFVSFFQSSSFSTPPPSFSARSPPSLLLLCVRGEGGLLLFVFNLSVTQM